MEGVVVERTGAVWARQGHGDGHRGEIETDARGVVAVYIGEGEHHGEQLEK